MLHKAKFASKSAYSSEDIDALISAVLKQIDFFDEVVIDETYWQEADQLTKGVDSKDISFVALALQTNGLLWTGDKKLTNHLKLMGFDRVVSTAGLVALLDIE
jgi:predicted nucleic acid-binding protein